MHDALLEPFHLSFSSSCRLVRYLTTIVEVSALAVLDTRQDFALGGGVALDLVCHDHPRNLSQALQQLAKEPLGGSRAAPALDPNGHGWGVCGSDDHEDRSCSRDHRNPEHQPEIVTARRHQQHCQQRVRPGDERQRFPIQRAELAKLNAEFWWLVGVAAILTLARFSEAFLLLAAEHAGMALALIPGVLVTMNIVYAASAYPLGRLSDRMSRRMLLLVGVGILIAADIVLATAGTVWQVMIGAAIWGLHMGATQGLLAALVVGTAPAHLRETAFGFYSLITGVALLVASVVAGWLWTALGPAATFMAGALFAGLALIGIVLRASPEMGPDTPIP